jgi:hypothetical protein
MENDKIKLAVKLEEVHETAKRFYKEEYAEQIEPFKLLILEVMKSNNIKAIPALIKISKTELYDNGMAQMLFMSATYDLITTA